VPIILYFKPSNILIAYYASPFAISKAQIAPRSSHAVKRPAYHSATKSTNGNPCSYVALTGRFPFPNLFNFSHGAKLNKKSKEEKEAVFCVRAMQKQLCYRLPFFYLLIPIIDLNLCG